MLNAKPSRPRDSLDQFISRRIGPSSAVHIATTGPALRDRMVIGCFCFGDMLAPLWRIVPGRPASPVPRPLVNGLVAWSTKGCASAIRVGAVIFTRIAILFEVVAGTRVGGRIGRGDDSCQIASSATR